MKIAVIGAGIVGVTTALELAQDGHQVTVFDTHLAAAEGSSFANAGVVAPGYVTPWAAPGMPWKVVSHLASRHSPVRFSWPLGSTEMAWMWRFYRACRPRGYAERRTLMQQLAIYSRARLHHIANTLQLEFDRSSGYMVLMRSERDRTLMESSLKVLREQSIHFQEINPDQARRIEPALNPDTNFFGAIHLPDDEVGNCRQFALIIKSHAQSMGVDFQFSKTVTSLKPDGEGWSLSIHDFGEPIQAQAVVICAGAASAELLRPLGIKIPLAPVYGYSISANVREPLNAPRSAVMDERYKVAISRIGQRVRVSGSAEIGGEPGVRHPAAIKTLYKVLQDWFPGAALLSQGVQTWKGARPMLPDGPPLIGPTPLPGLWLNLGHGSSGWALSCGSARLLADQIQGIATELPSEGFRLERYSR